LELVKKKIINIKHKILRKLVIILKTINLLKKIYIVFYILSQACLYFEIEMFKLNNYYVSGKDIFMAFIRSILSWYFSQTFLKKLYYHVKDRFNIFSEWWLLIWGANSCGNIYEKLFALLFC